jgi:hypothetical protein
MADLQRTVKVALAATFILAFTSVAQAQLNRSFVSAQIGNDANTCVPTAPCRGLTKALSVTNHGGEIIILDSGGYGASLTINKAVTIDATGVYAGMAVTAGSGIIINAGGSDQVVLRGLTLEGMGGSTGINFQMGGMLYVENCVINGFTGHGILFDIGKLFVKDTTIRNNGDNGIQIFPAIANEVIVSIDHSRLESNNRGILVQGSVFASVSIKDTVIANSTASGLFLSSANSNVSIEQSALVKNAAGITNSGGQLSIVNSNLSHNNSTGLAASTSSKSSIKDSTLSYNTTGVTAATGAVVHVTSSMLNNNITYGLQNQGGGATLNTYGNNALHGNGTAPTNGVITAAGLM